GVAVAPLVGDFAQDDDAGGAAVDAECAAGADVFVDDEEDVVFGVVAGLVGVDGVVDGVGGDHVDAFPGADVDAAFAEDALGLVDVKELLGLDRRGQERRVDLLELVVGDEVRHRRVRIGLGHLRNLPAFGGIIYRLRASPAGGPVAGPIGRRRSSSTPPRPRGAQA